MQKVRITPNNAGFITKDGALLFLQAVDLAQPITPPIQQAGAAFDAPDSEKPRVDFFVMSFCPYGQQAETGLKLVFDLFGDKFCLFRTGL